MRQLKRHHRSLEESFSILQSWSIREATLRICKLKVNDRKVNRHPWDHYSTITIQSATWFHAFIFNYCWYYYLTERLIIFIHIPAANHSLKHRNYSIVLIQLFIHAFLMADSKVVSWVEETVEELQRLLFQKLDSSDLAVQGLSKSSAV